MMSDPLEIAVNTLEQRAIELVEERHRVRRRLLEDSMRDVQIDRDIEGCFAGARALGWTLTISTGPTLDTGPKQNAQNQFISGRNQITQSYAVLKIEYHADSADEYDLEEGETDEDRPDMPRIADIILDRLQIAGESGSKAASIRRYILDEYNADIHGKTVGMTLYRMQKEGVVRRDGHVWFLVPEEARNPGVAAPGSEVGT